MATWQDRMGAKGYPRYPLPSLPEREGLPPSHLSLSPALLKCSYLALAGEAAPRKVAVGFKRLSLPSRLKGRSIGLVLPLHAYFRCNRWAHAGGRRASRRATALGGRGHGQDLTHVTKGNALRHNESCRPYAQLVSRVDEENIPSERSYGQ